MKSSKTPTVIAVTALVVAALAATPIGQAAGRFVLAKNSVGTAQLKKDAVTGAKVKNGSLLAADFRPGQLPSGQKGDPGPQGPKGESGAPGATKVVERTATGPNVGAGGYSTASVFCQPGETVVGGGGGGGTSYNGKPTMVGSMPYASNGWITTVRNDSAAGTVVAYTYALCATP